MAASSRGESRKRPRRGAPERFSRDDVDFMSDVNSAIREQIPKGGRTLLWTITLFLVAATVWAAYAEVNEVTRGSGRVIPSRQIQIVQNLEGGILSELLVSEGQVVEKGEVLLRIDDTRFASSYREGRIGYLTLLAQIARLQAEAEAVEFAAPEEVQKERPDLVRQEENLYRSRRQELETSRLILAQQAEQKSQELQELRSNESHIGGSYNLAARELQMTQPLLKEGAVSEVELLRLRRQVNDLRRDLENARLSIPRVELQYQEALKKIEEAEIRFRTTAREELNEKRAALAKIVEANQALEDRVRRTSVVSPLRGTIKQVLVNTIGGVIKPGMDLVEIVPLEDTLLVEAQIRPRDIAFLRPGLPSIVKLTAYDFAIYGALDAKLEHISADSIEGKDGETYYLVRVRTDRSYLGTEESPLPIISGMQVEVDILTGRRTILTYLLKPILRAFDRAMTER